LAGFASSNFLAIEKHAGMVRKRQTAEGGITPARRAVDIAGEKTPPAKR